MELLPRAEERRHPGGALVGQVRFAQMACRLKSSTHRTQKTVLRAANLGGASGRDSMTMDDLGGISSGNQRFACAHENQVGNRYCDVCGADRGRRCPLCSSRNRDQAKFCGACGARLLDEGTAPETVVANLTPASSQGRGAPGTSRTTTPAAKERASLLGSGTRFPDDAQFQDSEDPRWSGRSGLRRNDPLPSPTDDMTVEDDWAARDRRRKALLLVAAVAVAAAAAIAIVLGIVRPSPTRHEGVLDRGRGWLAADRGSASATRGEQPPALEGAASSATSSAPESETATPPAATSESGREAIGAPATPRAAELPAMRPSLPSRSRSESRATPGHEVRGEGTSRPLIPAPATSEERVADFLIERLGPAPAAEKALSTAAWYDAGRSEHAYWQRVGEAIRRRGGS